ncbi:hypothetical protein T310_8632, partial [Rasamsonia emersonii CBS 393.64]
PSTGRVRRSRRVRERARNRAGPVEQPAGDAASAHRNHDVRDAEGDGVTGAGERAFGDREGSIDHAGAGAEEAAKWQRSFVESSQVSSTEYDLRDMLCHEVCRARYTISTVLRH